MRLLVHSDDLFQEKQKVYLVIIRSQNAIRMVAELTLQFTSTVFAHREDSAGLIIQKVSALK